MMTNNYFKEMIRLPTVIADQAHSGRLIRLAPLY